MMPAIDPHRRFRRQMTLQVAACWILALFAAGWAWWVPRPAVQPVSSRPAREVTAPASTPEIDIDLWNVALWRPFVDEAPASAPAPPLTLKLYSILEQGDALIAAIAPGEHASLVYVEAGDTCHGFTVLRVEADGVVLRVDGREQRLELDP